MSLRKGIEKAVLAMVFVLTAVLPVAFLLGTIAAFFFPGDAGYDDTIVGGIRGLARDVRYLGLAGAVPGFLLLVGIGFGIRSARGGDLRRGGRIIGRAAVLAFLACMVVAPHTQEFRHWRVTFALAALGLTAALLAFGLAARKESRGRAP